MPPCAAFSPLGGLFGYADIYISLLQRCCPNVTSAKPGGGGNPEKRTGMGGEGMGVRKGGVGQGVGMGGGADPMEGVPGGGVVAALHLWVTRAPPEEGGDRERGSLVIFSP